MAALYLTANAPAVSRLLSPIAMCSRALIGSQPTGPLAQHLVVLVSDIAMLLVLLMMVVYSMIKSALRSCQLLLHCSTSVRISHAHHGKLVRGVHAQPHAVLVIRLVQSSVVIHMIVNYVEPSLMISCVPLTIGMGLS
jgi:hypothetical protein